MVSVKICDWYIAMIVSTFITKNKGMKIKIMVTTLVLAIVVVLNLLLN
jgi:hypothetical protein